SLEGPVPMRIWPFFEPPNNLVVLGSSRHFLNYSHQGLKRPSARAALSRSPLRMAGKESSEKSELINQERTETKTRHPRGGAYPRAQFLRAVTCKCKRNCDCSGHAHHPNHRSGTEDKQIDRCPNRV